MKKENAPTATFDDEEREGRPLKCRMSKKTFSSF